MTEAPPSGYWYRTCACGGFIGHDTPVCPKCKHFRPMACASCGKELRLTLCTYNKRRFYYCEEHCPDPPLWKTSYDSLDECGRCGVERGDYWERKYWALKARRG